MNNQNKCKTPSPFFCKTEAQRGFSITSVVISASIGLTLMLGLSSMIKNMQDTIGYIEDKQSAGDLKSMLSIDLSNPAVCERTLQTFSIALNQEVPSIKSSTGVDLYSTGNTVDKLEIQGLRLINESVNGAVPNSSGRMTLEVNVKRLRRETASLQPIKIPMSVRTGPDRKILSCTALGVGAGGENDDGRSCDGRPSPSDGYVYLPAPKYKEGSVVNVIYSSGIKGTRQYLCINHNWSIINDDTNPGDRGVE